MNKQTKYNSIVFLTTLCLGLVFVGSSPIIFGEVKSEKELFEEFERDVRLKDSVSLQHVDIPILFVRLLEEIKSEIDAERLSFPIRREFQAGLDRKEAPRSISDSSRSIGSISTVLFKSIDKNFTPRSLELADSVNDLKNVSIDIHGNTDALELRISFSKKDPHQYAQLLDAKYRSRKKEVSGIKKLAYKNTLASTQNNQVLVVTRLPRASIDSFLKGE